MRKIVLAALLAYPIAVTPLHAQFGGDNLLRLGIQILDGMNAGEQQRYQEAPRAAPSATPQAAPSSPLETAMVAEIQRLLTARGYPVGTIDGVAGSRTRQAIAAFQRDQGIGQTGQPNEALLQALRTAPAYGTPALAASPPAWSPQATAGPSFDCSAAYQPAERAICATPQLAGLDRQLAGIYATLSASGATTADAQRQWLAQRNACGADARCLAASYQQRLADLGGAGGLGGPSSLPSTFAETFTLLEGYDLPQGDYRSGLDDPQLAGIGPQSCQQLCTSDGRCRGFTYNLRAAICILKEAVGGQAAFSGAISGIKGAAGAMSQPGFAAASPASPTSSAFADFVHMALMSDTENYLAQAEITGVAYIAATGNEEQCRQLYEISRGDEFTRRDYLARSADVARNVIASLSTRPRRIEVPIMATYALAEYDFARSGFPFASYQQPALPILAAGTVNLLMSERPVLCRGGGLSSDLGQNQINFLGLVAEHQGAPGIDFLPMPAEEARAFRMSGDGKILVKSTLVVEPRDQGRGPLTGRIGSVSAHDPATGRLLKTWDIAGQDAPEPTTGDGVPLTAQLLASLVAPVIEPRIGKDQFDNAAAGYFRDHGPAIANGNLPPGSPLPLDVMRDRQPEVIAALNRDRLRAVMRENAAEMPVSVVIEQRIDPYYSEEKGLHFNVLQPHPEGSSAADILSGTPLSSRDLPLHENFFPTDIWGERGSTGFREAILNNNRMRMSLELDRLAQLPPIPMGIEQAAAHGLVGAYSGGGRDSVILRWDVEIRDVRVEEDVILGASLRSLSSRWASDNTPLASVAVAALPTVSELRQAVEAGLPPRATVENILPPPAGVRFDAEMADLLQLRFQPETVDDPLLQRMMIARFAYEANAGDQAPRWGSFFRDFGEWLQPDERASRLVEFRAWSTARADALPASVTISVPFEDTSEGQIAPFERRGPYPYDRQCRLASERSGTPTESEIAEEKLCAVIEAAWKAPEPLLYLNDTGLKYPNMLRSNCRNDDPYCLAIYNARVELTNPDLVAHNDVVALDRLPVVDAAVRAMKGRSLAIEIEVEPTGASVSPPKSLWQQAFAGMNEFAKTHAVWPGDRSFEIQGSGEEFVIFHARATSARIVDSATGETVAELALAAPAPLPFDTLAMPQSEVAGLDVLGIRIGTSFAEADSIIRDHMQVGKMLTADRTVQLGSVSGAIAPYSSGRMYVSPDGLELIAIFDEPPAVSQTVIGIWRILRLPPGGANPAELKATLAQRYGEPSVVEEVSLPFMRTGLALMWLDNPNERCNSIDFAYQDGIWRDETGNSSWLPPPMINAYYPILSSSTFVDVFDKPLPPASLCPQFLGVRYATYDGRNAGEHTGDELITWLSDNRAYSDAFHNSRTTAQAQPNTSAGSSKIKF